MIDCGAKRERVQQIRCLMFIQAIDQIAKLLFGGHNSIMSSTEIMRRHCGDVEHERFHVMELQRNRALLILQNPLHQ
jgi:hypothetical protein